MTRFVVRHLLLLFRLQDLRFLLHTYSNRTFEEISLIDLPRSLTCDDTIDGCFEMFLFDLSAQVSSSNQRCFIANIGHIGT